MEGPDLDVVMSEYTSVDHAGAVPQKPGYRSLLKSTIYFCTFCSVGQFGTVSEWQKHEYYEHQIWRHSKCPECFALACDDSMASGELSDANDCSPVYERKAKGSFCKHIFKDGNLRIEQRFWGCGFCCEKNVVPFSTWEDRCSHVVAHFEDGGSRDDWSFSRLMLSLLHQPQISDLWVEHTRGANPQQDVPSTYKWDMANPLCQKVLRELEIGSDSRVKQESLVNIAFILGAAGAPEATDSM